MKQYTLELAPLAPSIKEQLDKQEVYMESRDYEKYEKIRHSLNMVGFHLATESEMGKMVKRFYSKIVNDIYDENPNKED